jgi:hypothetical protein
MMMLYLFPCGTRFVYVYVRSQRPAPPGPGPCLRPPARRYGQAGGPREAAGGPGKARRRTVMTAAAVRYELRGIRAEIPRIRGGKALTPPKKAR